jgi:hypothetical protein
MEKKFTCEFYGITGKKPKFTEDLSTRAWWKN